VTQLASAWDPAPLVLAGAGLMLMLFAQAFRRLRRRGRPDLAGWPRLLLFVLAVVLFTLALVSPLDEIGDSYLLSGHMLQHVVIGEVAPALALVALRGPLLFFFLPRPVLRRLAPLRHTIGPLLRPRVSLAVWVAVVAGWHVPAAYDLALANRAVHDLEHASLAIVGVLLWMQIVDPARRERLSSSQRMAYMLALAAAGAVLAAVLAFSSKLLYPAYRGASPQVLGISPLRDQQLAGAVMLGAQLLSLCICASLFLRDRLGTLRLPTIVTHQIPQPRRSI
jgi:cytochrome c oxidase assembly factor CtaG